ncbi:MAG: LysM peptidoglycan-binding domain-containing protein [Candidatus Omnitrophica bacterium]|nr:LysM peptidoglycan-binding domain-containing protein [Candidatus Omnitrophota bacterium]
MKFKIIGILNFFFIFTIYTESYTIYHTVKKGENLYLISKRYGTTPEKLKKLNNLKSSNIYPGQKIIVGTKEEKIESEKKGEFIKDYYIVKKGDTLSKISKQFGLSISELKKMNNLKSSKLKIGQKIVVGIKKVDLKNVKKEINLDEVKPITDVSQKIYYKVCEGDTIESISEKFQIESEKLLQANLIRREDLKVGQILVIPPRDLLEDKVEQETIVEKHTDLRTKLIQEALNYLGTKYRYGGESRGGLDCSALTRLVYRIIGLNLPQNSIAQYQNGLPVNKKEALPGDLVFFKRGDRIGHVGIYLGNDLFIHASFTLKRVIISSLSEKYFKNRFAGFRRYLIDEDEKYFAEEIDVKQE